MSSPVRVAVAKCDGPGQDQANAVEYGVIHYNMLANGRIYLLLIYAKSAQDNVPANVLLKIKEALRAHD